MRRREGLTLLELLIALAVIAIVFLALASGQITSMQTTSSAREVADAKTFANRTLENIRADILQDLRADVAAATTDADKQQAWLDAQYGTCPGVGASEPPYSGSRAALCVSDSTVSPLAYSFYDASWVIGPPVSKPPPIEFEGLLQVNIRVDWTKGGTDKSLTLVDYISCSEVDLDACPPPVDPDPRP